MQRLTYQDFIEKVNELGFLMPSDKLNKGFPTIDDFVPSVQWWTGDPELDPWLWKDRVAEEKKLAYGSFFDGKKGFIAPCFYSIFVDAFHPRATMEERWESGKLGRYEWEFWNLLTHENRPLSTNEYRRMIGVTAKNGRSALDAAVAHLQMTFDVTVTGSTDMLDQNGKPYNKAMAFDKVEKWAPAEWFTLNPSRGHEEALEIIYCQAQKISGLEIVRTKEAFSKLLKSYQKNT